MKFKKWLKNSEYKDKDPLSIITLYCIGEKLTNLDGIEKFKNLEELYCSDNKLSSLKGVEKLTNLKKLHCYGNNLEHEYYDIFGSIKIKDYQQYLKQFYRKDKIKNLI